MKFDLSSLEGKKIPESLRKIPQPPEKLYLAGNLTPLATYTPRRTYSSDEKPTNVANTTLSIMEIKGLITEEMSEIGTSF